MESNSQLINTLQDPATPLAFKIILGFLLVVIILLIFFMVTRGVFNFFEMARVEYFKKKQFFTHFYFRKNKLSKEYKAILQQEFNFYNRLSNSEKENFEHRLSYYLKNWEFIGKQIEITNTMKLMVAATVAKLTFGFRNYKINTIERVIIYPNMYYSTITKQMHKGEFNLAYKALVFSWQDFLKGYSIQDDNLNLGVHESIHAIHFSFLKTRRNSTSAAIFLMSFYELTHMLDNNEVLKERFINSGYFRDYAFQNQFEFISVIVENFIETPDRFRSKFPQIYDKVKEMLNFNFAGY